MSNVAAAAAAVPAGGGAQDDEGTATIPNEVFNLVKSIVGAGVLSLPAGIRNTHVVVVVVGVVMQSAPSSYILLCTPQSSLSFPLYNDYRYCCLW